MPKTILFILGCFFLANCSGPQQKKTVNIESGGILQTIISSSVETLDPQAILFYADWQVSSILYEGLVGYEENISEMLPLLAESWSVDDGGLRWIFKLRKNIRFHDDPCFAEAKGREVTARDVLYTFMRIAAPETSCSNWYLLSGKIEGIDAFHNNETNTISGITILDNHHIQFRLTKSYATFLKILASPTTYIVPEEAVKFYGEHFSHHPVGTGPFRLARWKSMQEIYLVKNNHYWKKDTNDNPLPYLDAIRLKLESNRTKTLSEFRKGENHFVVADEKYYRTVIGESTSKYLYQVVAVIPGLYIRFLGFTMDTESPFARNNRLRHATAMAFNRIKLIQNPPGNTAILANSLVPPYFLNNKESNWISFNPKRAASLFQMENSSTGNRTITLLSNLESEDVLLLQETFKQHGINASLQFQSVQYYHTIVNKRPDIFRVSFLPSFPDPEEYYSLFYSKSAREINLTGYMNANFDALFEASMVEQNFLKRLNFFMQMEKQLRDDVPLIYLSHGSPKWYITHNFVHGLKVRFILPDYSEVWLEIPHDSQD